MSIASVWRGGHVMTHDRLRRGGRERRAVTHIAMGRIDSQTEEHRTQKPRYGAVA